MEELLKTRREINKQIRDKCLSEIPNTKNTKVRKKADRYETLTELNTWIPVTALSTDELINLFRV